MELNLGEKIMSNEVRNNGVHFIGSGLSINCKKVICITNENNDGVELDVTRLSECDWLCINGYSYVKESDPYTVMHAYQ